MSYISIHNNDSKWLSNYCSGTVSSNTAAFYLNTQDESSLRYLIVLELSRQSALATAYNLRLVFLRNSPQKRHQWVAKRESRFSQDSIRLCIPEADMSSWNCRHWLHRKWQLKMQPMTKKRRNGDIFIGCFMCHWFRIYAHFSGIVIFVYFCVLCTGWYIDILQSYFTELLQSYFFSTHPGPYFNNILSTILLKLVHGWSITSILCRYNYLSLACPQFDVGFNKSLFGGRYPTRQSVLSCGVPMD